jgi:hypothetical protein
MLHEPGQKLQHKKTELAESFPNGMQYTFIQNSPVNVKTITVNSPKSQVALTPKNENRVNE